MLDSRYVEDLLSRYNVPGMSVALVQDGRLTVEVGYGAADVTSDMRSTEETLFQAGSISKAVCSLAMLTAVDDGSIGLDDDVNSILTSWKLPNRWDTPVTFRMLASHTAGLDDGFGFPGYVRRTKLPSLVEILSGAPASKTAAVAVERLPAESMKYSGAGTLVMQLALEDCLDVSFAKCVKQRVFEPLGMQRSFFLQPLPEDLDVSAARGHDDHGKAMDVKWRTYPELAAAGMWSTAGDLARLLAGIHAALRGDKGAIISRDRAEEMLTPVGTGPYGIGFELNGSFFGHGGTTYGFTSNCHGDRTTGSGMAVMLNSWGQNANEAILEITQHER